MAERIALSSESDSDEEMDTLMLLYQNGVRNTAWRRRKQTQNCVVLPYLSTRADIFKRVNHKNLRCSALRGLRCLRLNVRLPYSKSLWIVSKWEEWTEVWER